MRIWRLPAYPTRPSRLSWRLLCYSSQGSFLAEKIIWALDHPAERVRLSSAARETGRAYDIDAFVKKMERLYTLLDEVSRKTRRRGILEQDLSFLGTGRPAGTGGGQA